MRLAFGIARLLAACVGVVALIARLDYSLGFAGSAVTNYFSYFTTQSAIAATVLWAISGIVSFRRRLDPPWVRDARLYVTTYQIASGVVFYLIVAGANATNYRLVVPASDQFLHYWLPMYAVLDWLLAPGRGVVRWRLLLPVLAFPLVWGAFTMLRGAAVGWYPYFFLDPDQVSGVDEFAAYALGVVAFILFTAALLTVTSRVLPHGVGHRALAAERPRATVPRAAGRQPAGTATAEISAGTAMAHAAPELDSDEIQPVINAQPQPQ